MSGSVLERLAVLVEDRLNAATPASGEAGWVTGVKAGRYASPGEVYSGADPASPGSGDIAWVGFDHAADAELIVFLRNLAPSLPGIIRQVDEEHRMTFTGYCHRCGYTFPCADLRMWLDEAKRQGISE